LTDMNCSCPHKMSNPQNGDKFKNPQNVESGKNP